MTDRCEQMNVDETCARLRNVLLETRGLGRRELLKALGRFFAGTALLASLPALLSGASRRSRHRNIGITRGFR